MLWFILFLFFYFKASNLNIFNIGQNSTTKNAKAVQLIKITSTGKYYRSQQLSTAACQYPSQCPAGWWSAQNGPLADQPCRLGTW